MGGAFSNPEERYYVFLKPLGQDNNRQNLVRRIEDVEEGTPPPVITWLSPARLQISYSAMSNVDKEVNEVDGIAIKLKPSQPYEGFVSNRPGIAYDPHWMATMTFDLLALPNSPPRNPFAATSAFSDFGCDSEFFSISEPLRAQLKRLTKRLEEDRRTTGQYPQSMGPSSVAGVAYAEGSAKFAPSRTAPVVRIVYHRVGASYALEMRFPDLQSKYRPATVHYDSRPATAFLSCTAIHSGTTEEIKDKGGFLSRSHNDAPIIFSPRLGVYTY